MNELSSYLKNVYGDNYITGENGRDLLIWGARGESEHIPRLCTLTVGYDYSPYSLTEDDAERMLSEIRQNDPAFDRLYDYGYRFAARLGIYLLVILYPSLKQEFDGKWEESKKVYDEEKVMFWCRDVIQDNDRIVTGAELRSLIYDKLGHHFEDKGTSTDENIGSAGYFRTWSRDCLSGRIAKFDLDGFIFSNKNGRPALIELDMSVSPVGAPGWHPRLKNKPDHKLQLQFARAIGAEYWLLHYGYADKITEDTKISFLRVKGISDIKKEAAAPDNYDPVYGPPDNMICDDDERFFLKSSRRVMEMPLTGKLSFDHVVRYFIENAAYGTEEFEPAVLRCPMCGAAVAQSPAKGTFYCSALCSMYVGIALKHKLTKPELLALLEGTPVKIDGKKFLPVMNRSKDGRFFWKIEY